MGLEARDCILIGDRLETDIRMGKESGMKTALVLTGVTNRKTLKASPIQPDYVLQSIADLEMGATLCTPNWRSAATIARFCTA